MGTILFTAHGRERSVRTNGGDAPGQTLLAIARVTGVAVLFNCEVGECAACIVDVRTLRAPATGVPPLTERERFLLQLMGRLSAEDIADADAGRRPARVRLACQYRVGDEDIVVDYGHHNTGG